MNESRKNRVLMGVVGALLLFAAYNFVFKPQRAELSSVRGDVATAQQSVVDANALLAAPVATTPPQTDSGAAGVPDDPALAALLRQLQTAADDASVALLSVDPAGLGDNPTGPGGSIQVSITATGPLEAVMRYLEQLRDMQRVLVVEQVSVDSQSGAPSQLKVAARVFTRQAPESSPAENADAVTSTTVKSGS